jgi:aspartate kinase
VLAGLKNEVEKTLAKVDRRFDGVNRAKVLTSGGELPTAALMSYVLNSEAVHSCHLDKVLWPIITDDIFENATPDYEMSAKNLSGLLSLLEDGKVVTVGGFLGLTHDGLETVLGRGGSDQTAVFLSRLLSSHFAVETILFKDTPVQTADPSIVKDQPLERVPMMTYNEAQKATIAGMNIVQNAAVRIARSHNLTIMVAPLSNPTLGTMIQRDDTTNQTVKCVTGSRNCAIITMNNEKSRSLEDCLRLWEDYDGFLDLGAEVMDTGQVLRDFLILDANFVRKYEKQLRSFDKEMQVEYGVGIVTLVGDKMRTSPGIASKAIHSIPNINIKRGVFAPHTSQVILILNEADVPDAVRAIHSAIDIGISSN